MLDNGFLMGLAVGLIGGAAVASNRKVRMAIKEAQTFVMDKFDEVTKKVKSMKDEHRSADQCREDCDCDFHEAIENN